jgi:hypothetical protein
MNFKINKYLLLSFLIVLLIICISFYQYYKPKLKYVNEYNIIKENCYEKKNVNHEFCRLSYYQDEEYLKWYVENNNPQESLKELDIVTVTSEIVKHEAYSVMQFLSPLIIMIAVIGSIHTDFSTGMIKNYLTRESYNTYIKKKYLIILKSALIIPVSLVIIFIVSCFTTNFNTNVADSVKEIAVYSDFKYSYFCLYFIGICIIQFFMSILFANIGLFCCKKNKNKLVAMSLGYILFLIIDIVIYIVIYALILVKIFNLNIFWEYFNITGYWFADSGSSLLTFLIFAFVLQLISSICIYYFYKNKEGVVQASEKQIA